MKHIVIIILVAALGITGGWIITQNLPADEDEVSPTATTAPTTTGMMEDDKMDNDDSMTDENDSDQMMADDDKMITEDTPTPTPSETTTADRYQVYDEMAFNNDTGSNRVMFFYAAWCPTCRPADAEFTANENLIPDNVTLYRVNYDTETELKQKYGITYQHTFVQVDANGNEVAKWNGGGLDDLLSNVQT